MGGSTADTPTTPESLRVSDADRDDAVNELRNEFVDGRLSHETFVYRMQTALDARNRGQLAGLFTDLPPRRSRLLARIKAALRGDIRPQATQAGPAGLLAAKRSAHGHLGVPGQFGGSGHLGGPGQFGGAGSGHGPSQANGSGSQVSGMGSPGGSPAPFFFPPGRGDRFTIGRTRDCDLCLTDLSVSRLHAELLRGSDGWLLTDLGSHNGTRLNGWLVRETVAVRAGDWLEFGSQAFVVQTDPSEPGVPPPSG